MNKLVDQVITSALARVGSPKKTDRGNNWACYCKTCCLIRAPLKDTPRQY